MTGKSALEFLEAGLTNPHWLFRRRREGVLGRTLSTENVSTVSAMVLDVQKRRESKGAWFY